MSDPVICEVVVAAPADAVWHALREPAELRRWFGWDDDLCGHPHKSAMPRNPGIAARGGGGERETSA